MTRCAFCDKPLDYPIVRITFELKKHQPSFRIHARCLRAEPTEDARKPKAVA